MVRRKKPKPDQPTASNPAEQAVLPDASQLSEQQHHDPLIGGNTYPTGFPFPVQVPPPVIPDEMSDIERQYLDQVRAILTDLEHRVVAVTRAAGERYTPGIKPDDSDEHDRPVMGDEEYNTVLAMTQAYADVAMIRELGHYFSIPKELTDPLMIDQLRVSIFRASGKAPRKS